MLAVAVIAITLVPALCTIFIRGRVRGERDSWVVRSVADVLGSNQAVASEVFGILGHDQHTFTHVVNVSSYAVLLAGKLDKICRGFAI